MAVLRHYEFEGGVTILPYLNPRRWQDIADAVLYTRFADSRDRVYLGSTRRRGSIDAQSQRRSASRMASTTDGSVHRPAAAEVLQRLGIPRGRMHTRWPRAAGEIYAAPADRR